MHEAHEMRLLRTARDEGDVEIDLRSKKASREDAFFYAVEEINARE